MTSKVILTNVQVLAAGTKIERDTDKGKPMPVSVVTMLVTPKSPSASPSPRRKARSARAAQPARQEMPVTRGIRPAPLLGFGAPTRTAVHPPVSGGVTEHRRSCPPRWSRPPPTVEIIRGDKRAHRSRAHRSSEMRKFVVLSC